MNKPIAIIAGEPNSISSEIIFKSWKYKKQYRHKPMFIIGSIKLLSSQMKKLKYKIKIKKINKNFIIKDLNGMALPVYDINYVQKKPFDKISIKSNKYIFKCFSEALNFVNKKKISGFINCPVSKETLFKNKHQGITEYLANKCNKKNDVVMLIYNKKLSVVPLTTHVPINQVTSKIRKMKIVKKIKVVNNFYKSFLNKKPNFAILGLNPHNYFSSYKSKEKTNIENNIKILKKLKINIKGPFAADTSFVISKKNKFDVIIGMYHDQVLSPFKTIFNFNAINITLGLPFIRVSPDHGVGKDITGKKIANPNSLIESIKFFNSIK